MSRKNHLKILLLLSSCLYLTACAHTGGGVFDRSPNYLKAKQEPPLHIPADLSAHHISNSYVVPLAYSDGPVPVSYKPPGLTTNTANTVAQHQGGAPKPTKKRLSKNVLVVLTKNDQHYPVLEVHENLQAVWQPLNHALQKAGYNIVDANTIVHIYYIKLPKSSRSTLIYQIHVIAVKNTTEISVTDNYGYDLDPRKAYAILQVLSDKLQNMRRFPAHQVIHKI